MNPRILVAAIGLLVLAGCGKSLSQSATEAAVSAATGGKVQVSQSGDQQQMTIKDDKGNAVQVGSNVPLPKDFPADVHLPSSYTVRSALTAPQAVIVDLHSPAAVQALYSEYDSTMKSGGWTEAMAMQSSQSESVLTFQKDKRSVVVTIVAASDGGGSDVHLQSTTGQN